MSQAATVFAWARSALHVPGGVSDDAALRLRTESYADPAGFVDLLAAAAPVPVPRKSDLQGGIDLFYDLVTVWSESTPERPIFRHYDALAGWRSLSYRELSTRAIALACALQKRGCTVGDGLALLLPWGPDWLIGWCAALRLGMQILPLQPLAPELIAQQLALLQPHTLYTATRYRRLLPDAAQASVLLVDSAPPAHLGSRSSARGLVPASDLTSLPSSHTYAGDDPVLTLCSPISAAAPLAVSTRTARELYAGALRDALLLGLYGLDDAPPIDASALHLFAPGLHLLQHAPALLLAGLAAGATLVDAPLGEVTRHPNLWRAGRVPVQLLLLPTDLTVDELTALLTNAAEGALPSLRRLLICPFLPRGIPGLRGLAPWLAAPALADVVASHLHLDSASGGAVLYSDPRRGALPNTLHVALSCRHRLEDPLRPGQPTVQASGRLRLLDAPAGADGELLLSRVPSGYFLGGTLAPRRRGRSFPREQVLAFVRQRGFAEDCSLVQQAGAADGEFHLLIFLGAGLGKADGNADDNADNDGLGKADDDGISALTPEALGREIALALGPLAVPDHIVLLPISPRRRNGQVDHGFYQSSYDSGLLPRLCRDPALLAISTLRGLTARAREIT